MKKITYKNLLLTILSVTFLTHPAGALTDAVKKLVEFETKANAATERSTEAVLLPHVEIPIAMVGVDFAKRLDPRIASALIFQRAGKTYVRWILNPEDTKWGKELISYFKTKGVNLTLKYQFIGYQTASRSYIAEDPASGVQFSVKSSTDTTGGAWRDKKQPVGEAIDGRLLSDFIYAQNRKKPFETFTVMDEPAILKVGAIDQAVVIRDIGEIKDAKSRMYYLPGFSALHETVGAEIAAKNGSADPYKFWTENYIKPAGRALGEFAARTGLQFDSPHSQNFLVELDHSFKPTGRLVLRDMSDLYIDVTVVEALLGKNSDVLKKFNQKDNMLKYTAAAFGPLHGNKMPSWVNEELYTAWKDVYFDAYKKSFEKTTGFDLSHSLADVERNQKYFSAGYSLSDKPQYKNLYEMMRLKGVVENHHGAALCQAFFAATGS